MNASGQKDSKDHRTHGVHSGGHPITSGLRLQPASLAVYLLWATAVAFLGGAYFFLSPNLRLIAGTVGLLVLIKATILLRVPRPDLRQFSKMGITLYTTLWPGMDPAPFRKRSDSRLSPIGWLPGGLISFAAGLCVGVAACFLFPRFPNTAEWMVLFALLLMIHFGISEILTAWMRRNRWNVSPLFNAPLKSLSLQDFWGRRWNLAFVEMDKILFLPWLRQLFKTPAAVFGIFLISGLLHEAAVSYPVGRGWGLPTLYFALHGFLVLIEARFLSVKNWPTPIARLWTWVWILAPLPLLFHAAFRETFLKRLLEWMTQFFI